jgi:methyl-accepting chemotaxis protein
MSRTAPFTQLIRTVRTESGTLLDRAIGEAAEQIAQFSGRAASWADQAGEAVAEVGEEAATTAATASRSAADSAAETAEWYAGHAGGRLTRAAGRCAGSLSDFVLRIGDAVSDPREPRSRRD